MTLPFACRGQKHAAVADGLAAMAPLDSWSLGQGHRAADAVSVDQSRSSFVPDDDIPQKGRGRGAEDFGRSRGAQVSEVLKARRSSQLGNVSSAPTVPREESADDLLEEALAIELGEEVASFSVAKPVESSPRRGRQPTKSSFNEDALSARSGSPDVDELLASGEEEWAASRMARTRPSSPGCASVSVEGVVFFSADFLGGALDAQMVNRHREPCHSDLESCLS